MMQSAGFAGVNRDPYASYVKLFIKGDGVNAGTTIIDERGHTISNTNVTTSTTQSKSGATSLSFPGTTVRLDCGDHTDWDIGSGDFCWEWWTYPNSFATTGSPASQQATVETRSVGTDPEAGCITFYVNTSGFHRVHDGTTNVVTAFSSALSTGVWQHIAWVRSGGTLKGYLDGVEKCSVASTTNFAVPTKLVIGAFLATTGGGVYPRGFYNGYIDLMRLTVGVPRYTAAFTPTVY